MPALHRWPTGAPGLRRSEQMDRHMDGHRQVVSLCIAVCELARQRLRQAGVVLVGPRGRQPAARAAQSDQCRVFPLANLRRECLQVGLGRGTLLIIRQRGQAVLQQEALRRVRRIDVGWTEIELRGMIGIDQTNELDQLIYSEQLGGNLVRQQPAE